MLPAEAELFYRQNTPLFCVTLRGAVGLECSIEAFKVAAHTVEETLNRAATNFVVRMKMNEIRV